METAVEKIFNLPKEMICSKQPIGVSCSSTIFVDLSKLSDRADVRADDLGVWINQGVQSKYCSVQFEKNMARRIQKFACQPAVMRASVYRCKRSYWYHAEDSKFVRRLIEIEGIFFQYLIQAFQYNDEQVYIMYLCNEIKLLSQMFHYSEVPL